MNSYTSFSEIYDSLMHPDINYEHIADFIENLFDKFDKSPDMIVDLACGTGNLTLPLARRGYDMIGIDKSFDMLTVARKKAKDNKEILFLNQVLNPNSLYEMFKKIKTCFLNPGGIVIFDISSEYKLKNIIGNNTFIHDDEDIFYSWENRFIEKYSLSDMYLNFFVKDVKLYERFVERHLQKAYSQKTVKEILKKAGFKKITAFDGFSFEKANSKSERIVFVAE